MLTQSEADALFVMPKKPKSSNSMIFPHAGEKLLAELVSLDDREVFLFNITRGSIEIYKKASDAERGYKVIFYFTEEELNKVHRILTELNMTNDTSVMLVDARNDNKPSGSKA